MDKLLKEELIYKEKINKSYSGLVFDLDGTILNKDGYIYNSIIDILRNFTRNGINIILATGRGPKDTDELFINNELLTNNYAYSVNYNGSIIREIKSNNGLILERNINEIFLNNSEDIFNIIVKNKFLKEKLLLKSDGNYKYSDFDNYGITLHFKEDLIKSNKIINESYIIINNLLKTIGFNDIKITISGKTIDIFSNEAGKENGIIRIANEIGVDSNKLLRIGDQGGILGNDYCMLGNYNGITVGIGESAVKVFSDNGEILIGENAIKRIINDIKLINPNTIKKEQLLCNQDFFNDQIKIYKSYSDNIKSRFEEKANYIINKIISLNGNKFKEKVDFSKMFSFNGSILFSDEILNDKNFNIIKKYLINYGGQIYGRGKIFYFFENFTNDSIGREIESENHFNKIIEYFFSKFEIIIKDYNYIRYDIGKKDIYSEIDYKFYLTILDHLKLFTLKLLHFLSFGKCIGLNIDNNDLILSKKLIRDIMREYYSFFELNGINNIINLNQILNLLQKYKYTSLINSKNSLDIDFKLYNRIIRGVPEVSHPYINYIYGNLAYEGLYSNNITNPIIIGTHFGGIEIPYVLEYFINKNGNIVKDIIGVHNSKYELEGINGKLENNGKYDIDRIGDIVKGKDIIITDDGVFSGNTILDTGFEIMKLSPKNIYFSTQTFAGDRAGEIYKINGGVGNNLLEELFKNGLTRILPIFTGKSQNKNRLFNIEEQRIVDIISKGKDL